MSNALAEGMMVIAGMVLAGATALSAGATTCYAQETAQATPPPAAIVAPLTARPVKKDRPYWIIGVVAGGLSLAALGIELGVGLHSSAASSGTSFGAKN